MIVDNVGKGLHWANRQIANVAQSITGRYVYVLDDDDFITCEDFVSGLKQLLAQVKKDPDMIIARGWLLERMMPDGWMQMPRRGKIAAPNMIVRNDVFKFHARKWDTDRAGDWRFLNSVMKIRGTANFYWWDKVIFYADPTGAKDEQEKIKCRAALSS